MIAMMTSIRTVSEGDDFCCIPSDYTKTEYGFWANPAFPLKNPTNDLPFSIVLIDVIMFLIFLAFLVPTLFILLSLPLICFLAQFCLPCSLLGHTCFVLLWWRLLGRYLKGVAFKCSSCDYTKTEYGFWANWTMPLRNQPMICPFLSTWLIGYVLYFPMPSYYSVGIALSCLWAQFSSVSIFGSCLFFIFAMRTPIRTVS